MSFSQPTRSRAGPHVGTHVAPDSARLSFHTHSALSYSCLITKIAGTPILRVTPSGTGTHRCVLGTFLVSALLYLPVLVLLIRKKKPVFDSAPGSSAATHAPRPRCPLYSGYCQLRVSAPLFATAIDGSVPLLATAIDGSVRPVSHVQPPSQVGAASFSPCFLRVTHSRPFSKFCFVLCLFVPFTHPRISHHDTSSTQQLLCSHPLVRVSVSIALLSHHTPEPGSSCVVRSQPCFGPLPFFSFSSSG